MIENEVAQMTRKERLIASIPSNIDALFITNTKNQFYLTGFDYTDGLVVVTRDKSYVFADFRYIEAAKNETSSEFEVVLLEGKRGELYKSYLNNYKTIGFEDASLTYEELKTYEKILPDFEFVPAGRIVEELRTIKDENELETIIEAQRTAEKAFDHILGFITPDKLETEVALELEYTMRKLGAKCTSFDTIAVSGKASALPHGVPRCVKLEKGFFTMDFGAFYKGYCSDMTRTVVIGKADDEMKKVYNTVLEAQLAALDAFEIGKTGYEIDKIARDIIYGAGYEGCFGHGLGHGVGMDVHEAPSVNARGNTPFANGHVVTCEPGIYIEGKYGVRIEDMVVFSGGKAINITKCPKNLIEL